jgi:hypothetical protein
LGDFSNQGYTFVSMDSDLAFENYLKH